MNGKRILTIAAVALMSAWPAMAQDGLGLWDINGDVDGDGIVGPTDIQHVINSALGLLERGPEALNRPVRQYIVASPRASLALAPQLQPLAQDGAEIDPDVCDTVGATYNFPRDNGRILVRQGTAVIFRFDRRTEGVWFPGACGLLRSELELDMRRASGDPSEWVSIGRDGAQGRNCGPAIATENIGVRHLFSEAGDFVVRATVRSFAIPAQEEGLDEGSRCGASRSVDEVLIGVRVVGPETRPDDFDWEDAGQVESVPRRYGEPYERDEAPSRP